MREVAVALRIDLNTVQRAYAELERDGLLTLVRGRGTFVAEAPPARDHKPRCAKPGREGGGPGQGPGIAPGRSDQGAASALKARRHEIAVSYPRHRDRRLIIWTRLLSLLARPGRAPATSNAPAKPCESAQPARIQPIPHPITNPIKRQFTKEASHERHFSALIFVIFIGGAVLSYLAQNAAGGHRSCWR